MDNSNENMVKSTLKDFVKEFEKNKKCKILEISKTINDGIIIYYKREKMYFIDHIPNNQMQILNNEKET